MKIKGSQNGGLILSILLVLAGAISAAAQAKGPAYVFWPMKRYPVITYSGRINGIGAASGDRYCFTTSASLVYAFDLVQMKELWQFKTKAPVSYPPAVAGGLIIAVDDLGEVYGLDEKGQAAWTQATGEPADGGPILLGERILIHRKAGHFSVLDGKSGKIEGTLAAGGGEPIDSWCVAEDGLFAVVRGGAIVVLGPDGKEKDRIKSEVPYRGPLAVSKETILAGKEGGVIESFDRGKRKPRWSRRLGSPFKAIRFMGEKRICLLTTNDILFCLAGRSGDLIWWRGGNILDIPLPMFWQKRIVGSFGTREIFGLVDRTGESRWRFDVGTKIVGDFHPWRGNMVVHMYDKEKDQGALQLMGPPEDPAKSP